MSHYQKAIQKFCAALDLTGRILIGLSNNAEGINGTLAGTDEWNVRAFTYALLGLDWCRMNAKDLKGIHHLPSLHTGDGDGDGDGDGPTGTGADLKRTKAIEEFWVDCHQFSSLAKVDAPQMNTPEDFKWSTTNSQENQLFPDLNIKVVKEIISTGGLLSSVEISETSKDYLTPDEWHEEMKRLKAHEGATSSANVHAQVVDSGSGSSENKARDTILIDCRNHKEYAIGHFEHSVDPNTKNFAQFPRWVKENKSSLKDKNILMYCTGGIRCEKASAFIRRELSDVSSQTKVRHLKGGIHKYLDVYGGDGYFKGKNFVFDKRVVADTIAKTEEAHNKNSANTTNFCNVVGKCVYCNAHHDNFTADSVCTVCRELTLVCMDCRTKLHGEYHCSDHQHLKDCYFTNLSLFERHELEKQLQMIKHLLSEIAVGKRYKQKRKTLHKQCDRLRHKIKDFGTEQAGDATKFTCRNCGEVECDGTCWGFHGLGRKEKLDSNYLKKDISRSSRVSANKRTSKQQQKEKEIHEIKVLKLSQPPSSYRDVRTSLRCPPPYVRVVQSSVKGKWCGKSVGFILKSEFADLSNEKRLQSFMDRSLIRVNNIPVNSEDALKRGVDGMKAFSPDMVLKNMDVLSRIIYWYEPPIIVPESIPVQKIILPEAVCNALLPDPISIAKDHNIYCCDKPASVPVHPAGPYYQNTLLLMIEAQEGLQPRQLLPCHRLDRCTSGLTLCCTNPKIARLLQTQMDLKTVSKMYLARVKGKFPGSRIETEHQSRMLHKDIELFLEWNDEKKYIEFNAPIEVTDPGNGVRAIRASGKPSRSRFQLLAYDKDSDTSLISCCPITGRGHQLRVHLRGSGFPIHNDVQYGGTYNKAEANNRKAASIKAIQNVPLDRRLVCADLSITEQDIQGAKETSLFSQGGPGIEDSFNAAQLNEHGHAIDLHALKYKINFTKRTSKRKAGSDDILGNRKLGIVEFETDMPSWTSLYEQFELRWLQD